jgi:predicted ATPase
MRPLDSIEIQGFKTLEAVEVDLSPLNILIGANGAGKSNFMQVFGLLRAIVDSKLQLHVERAGGANSFLFRGAKQTGELRIRTDFDANSYEVILEPTADDHMMIARETVSFKGWDKLVGEASRETNLGSPLSGAARIVNFVRPAIESWRRFHFHDTSDSAAVKRACGIDDNRSLKSDAANLAAVLYLLSKAHPDEYRRIVLEVRAVAPFFDEFALREDPLAPGRIKLEWLDRDGDTYTSTALSDGTLRYICLATLLLQPELPKTILIDEPELGLHPSAVARLAGLFRKASKRTQIVIATQSVTLVNQFGPEDLVLVERDGCATTLRRPDEQEILSWLDDYALGDLWEKNVIGARPDVRVGPPREDE